MMEHVLMHDWYDNKRSDDGNFVKEEDIDNCAIERLLRNEFHDPLASSSSEDEGRSNNINWDKIFKGRNQPPTNKLYVPCLRRSPPYPRVSELNQIQHKQILKIISAEYPNVLKGLPLGKPKKNDVKAFEDVKETYLKEQKEYQKWAKSLWVTDHCVRTLRPGRIVERLYEAECQMKARRVQALPKHYNVAAQITLENPTNNYDAVLKQDLIRVTLAEMPIVQIPDNIDKQLSIVKAWIPPKPCQKHQYQIVLPNEDALSMLPITEIHYVLASYALKHHTRFIASENALKCLTQRNRHWLLPVSICETTAPNGNRVNVLVLDSEFTVHKEPAHMRTYKAYRHMLELALIPLSEKQRICEMGQSRAVTQERKISVTSPKVNETEPAWQDVELSSDDDDESNHLFIDTGEEPVESTELKSTDLDSPKAGPSSSGILYTPKVDLDESTTGFSPPPAKQKRVSNDQSPRRTTRISGHVTENPPEISSPVKRVSNESPTDSEVGVYSCTCKGTMYEKPPRRSFKKFQFSSENNDETLDVIIHCPHKAKDKTGELLLEPIPEYQIDLGASEQTPDAVRSVALALALRKNAALLNVRVDGPTGEVAAIEKLTTEAFAERYPDVTRQVISTAHTALSQLQALRPGHYVLQHEPSHGPNAMLMCPTAAGQPHSLRLAGALLPLDEADIAKCPPTICTALLPYHKSRRVLPCAFTPYENMVVKQHYKKPPQPNQRQSQPQPNQQPSQPQRKRKRQQPQNKKNGPQPPQAIQYPKRKRRKTERW